MLLFLQNSWVVGIGGGIISGIIVYFITGWLYKRKDNSKYLEQIKRANLDIIHALKPYVVERGLPTKEIVDAIIVSTARKYNVKSDELYSIRIICEELICEIIENVYVSSDRKQEYAKQLQEYLHELDVEKHKEFLISDIEKEIKNSTVFNESNYQRKTATMLSSLLAALTGVATTLSIALYKDIEIVDMYSFTLEFASYIVVIVTIIFVVISIYVIVPVIGRNFKSKTRSKK